MSQDAQLPVPVVTSDDIAWAAHPRFPEILMKQLLTAAANPLASVSRVRVPPGGAIGWHQHGTQTETVYVLAGESMLTLDQTPVRFRAGCIVAIPPAVRHTLINDGAEPVELLCFFTPPIA